MIPITPTDIAAIRDMYTVEHGSVTPLGRLLDWAEETVKTDTDKGFETALRKIRGVAFRKLPYKKGFVMAIGIASEALGVGNPIRGLEAMRSTE